MIFQQGGRNGSRGRGVTGRTWMNSIGSVRGDPFIASGLPIGFDYRAGIPESDAAGKVGIVRLRTNKIIEGLPLRGKGGKAGFIRIAGGVPEGEPGGTGHQCALNVGQAVAVRDRSHLLPYGPFEGRDFSRRIMHPDLVDPILVEQMGHFSLMDTVIAQNIDK